MRLRMVALYFTVGLLVAAALFTISLSLYPNDGRPFTWNRNEVVNV